MGEFSKSILVFEKKKQYVEIFFLIIVILVLKPTIGTETFNPWDVHYENDVDIDYFYDADHDAQEDYSETHGEEIDGLAKEFRKLYLHYLLKKKTVELIKD